MHRIANPFSPVRLRAAPPPLAQHVRLLIETPTMTISDDLAADYDRLRDELKRLLAAPVKDMVAVSAVIDRLDDVHMKFKAAHGLRGNNPNE